VNGRAALPAIMAICSLLLFVSVGISSQGLAYFKNALFPPGIPWPVYILLTPIEFVSTFIVRPVTLAIRLLANMIAGHLILSVFFVASGYMLTSMNISVVFGVGALIFSAALIAFELFVAGLQAYVFTILSAVYIAGALEPEH
jgi:F-type H+-transporting ATPase subunit a